MFYPWSMGGFTIQMGHPVAVPISSLFLRMKSLIEMMEFPTQRADVYAFGIILHEIFYRKGPWGRKEHSYRELQGRSINVDQSRIRLRRMAFIRV